jgi:hypothetical protein
MHWAKREHIKSYRRKIKIYRRWNTLLTSFSVLKIAFERKYIAVAGGAKDNWMSSGTFEESDMKQKISKKITIYLVVEQTILQSE